MQQTANQYKKLMEKVEFFSFQMELEGNRYVHVLYQRFQQANRHFDSSAWASSDKASGTADRGPDELLQQYCQGGRG